MKKLIMFLAIMAVSISAQADDMKATVERFKEVAYLAEAHCEDSYMETEKCLDRQFNCFAEVRNLEGISESAFKKALTDAFTYNRKGEAIAVNFCEFKRKAQIYQLKEQVGAMR